LKYNGQNKKRITHNDVLPYPKSTAGKIQRARNKVTPMMKVILSSEPWFLHEQHGVIFRKTAFFIVTDGKT
jgi:hypothetical protein